MVAVLKFFFTEMYGKILALVGDEMPDVSAVRGLGLGRNCIFVSIVVEFNCRRLYEYCCSR